MSEFVWNPKRHPKNQNCINNGRMVNQIRIRRTNGARIFIAEFSTYEEKMKCIKYLDDSGLDYSLPAKELKRKAVEYLIKGGFKKTRRLPTLSACNGNQNDIQASIEWLEQNQLSQLIKFVKAKQLKISDIRPKQLETWNVPIFVKSRFLRLRNTFHD